jgi:hypothetical protein
MITMKNVHALLLVFWLITAINTMAQNQSSEISEMHWELDYEIFLKLSNDSSLSLNINDLFHIKPGSAGDFNSEFVYYPVSLNDKFVNSVRNRESLNPSSETINKTLWGALHESLGGGWVHFTNCLLYALETENLSLTAPLMKRPDTKWKPKPVTESYRRTKKWKYYAPVNQKYAIKEYKIKKEENRLGDLQNIPESMIQTFLGTKRKDYQRLKDQEKLHQLAKIDLVKLLLAASYLSEPQIAYIRSSVLNAVKQYSASRLPTVIVFDEFDAAAAMSLDVQGYGIENIVFRKDAGLNADEKEERSEDIRRIIDEINHYNRESFKTRLERYYSG